jgi:hypothetical protein
MRKKGSTPKPRSSSEQQLSGLRASTAARKQETVERLKAAIESLKAKKQAITAQSIYAESGLHYSTYVRNEEAIAVFRANSTHLTQKKKQRKPKRTPSDDAPARSRDPLMNYKKPQLVARLREAENTIQCLEQQLAQLASGYLEQDARVAELEARLVELEPYQTFVEQVRQRVRYEEHGGNAPSSW